LNNLCIYSGGYCKAAVIEFLVGITGAVRFSGCARHGLAGDLVDGGAVTLVAVPEAKMAHRNAPSAI